jgi:hypothetical protein
MKSRPGSDEETKLICSPPICLKPTSEKSKEPKRKRAPKEKGYGGDREEGVGDVPDGFQLCLRKFEPVMSLVHFTLTNTVVEVGRLISVTVHRSGSRGCIVTDILARNYDAGTDVRSLFGA